MILLALSKEASVKKEIVFFTASYAAYSLFLLYLRSKSAYSGAAGTFINPAVTALSFILALGNFTGNQILAPFAGAAFLTGAAATVVYVVKNKRVKDNLFPLCLLSFGLAHTLGVGLGRGGASPILVGGFRSHAALIAFCAFSLIVYNEFISGRAVLKSGTKKILAKFMVKDLLAVFLIFGVLSNTLLLSAGHYKKELRENQRLTLNYRNLTFDDLRHIHGGGVVFKNFDIFEYLEERKWLLWRKNASRY